jgi:hypothetical protein
LKCFLHDDITKYIRIKFQKEGIDAINELRRKIVRVAPWQSLPIIGLDAGSSISLGVLIVTLIGTFLTTFIQSPILDYEVTFMKENNQYIIKINNYGNAPAKNVLISLEQNETQFNNFKSNPFLSNHFKSNSSKNLEQVEGFVELDVVPAFSKIDIIAQVDPSSSPSNITNKILKVNVRSDETVGKQNTIFLILFYLPLLLVFLIIPILFWRGYIERQTENFLTVVLITIIGAFLGSIVVSYYFRL